MLHTVEMTFLPLIIMILVILSYRFIFQFNLNPLLTRNLLLTAILLQNTHSIMQQYNHFQTKNVLQQKNI